MNPREEIITHRGRSNVNRRTWQMIQAAENLAGFRFVITQGSYNKGGVKASGGTHDGGGVVDIRARDLSPVERGQVVLALRKVGFAAWLRSPKQAHGKWPWHIHAVAKGDLDLSKQAAAQVVSYLHERNGLAKNGPDDGPPGYYKMTWNLYRELRQNNAKIPPGDNRPRNSLGQLCLSYKAIQYAGVHRAMSDSWAAYRNSAHRSIKTLFPVLRNAPDTQFPESWLFMERAIRRHPPSAIADVYSWYWFVGRFGFHPPDHNDWPAPPRRH
ncbi:MAG TPA: hypothetical protein VEK80_02220 [Kribbellaceae bacterium]|nr:hypothetical protein [Kribbellaceae bacterium]